MQKSDELLIFMGNEHRLNARHYCTTSSPQYEAGIIIAIYTQESRNS